MNTSHTAEPAKTAAPWPSPVGFPTEEECQWVVKSLIARNPQLFEVPGVSHADRLKVMISVWLASTAGKYPDHVVQPRLT